MESQTPQHQRHPVDTWWKRAFNVLQWTALLTSLTVMGYLCVTHAVPWPYSAFGSDSNGEFLSSIREAHPVEAK